MNEQITDTIANLMQSNKELKLSISEMNNVLSRLNGAIRADIDKQVDEAYQRGLNDAWEAAKKISLMSPDKIENVFPGAAKYNRYNLGYSGVEAIERLKAYEKTQDTIQVGDEVRHDRGWTAVVTAIDELGLTLLGTNGAIADYHDKSRFTKTGRRFPQVAQILEEMEHED